MKKAHDVSGSLPPTFDTFKLHLCKDIQVDVIGWRDAQRNHIISANLIRFWLTQADRGDLTDQEAEARVIGEYEARIVALERKGGPAHDRDGLVKKNLKCRSKRSARNPAR